MTNRYNCLSVDLDDCVSDTILSRVFLGKKGENTSVSHRAAPVLSLPFTTTVNIENDNYGRHLAGFETDLVRTPGTRKPGAKLLDVVSSSPPPPGSCCVIIAGTDDVAVGQ